MVQEISKYDEKKYLVTKGQYQELVSRMITRVKPGPYGKYLACNVYFAPSRGQTENLFLEEGPVCKEKLRLRSYGVPKEKDTVYIELHCGFIRCAPYDMWRITGLLFVEKRNQD